VLQELQDNLIARATGHPYFQGPPAIKIVPELLSDLQQQIANTLGKVGLIVVVREPSLKPGKFWSTVDAEIETQIIENPLLNKSGWGTGQRSKDVATALMRLWTYADMTGPGQCQMWDPGAGWEPMRFVSFAPVNVGDPLIYKLIFNSTRKL
jgi:hypothetical protein